METTKDLAQYRREPSRPAIVSPFRSSCLDLLLSNWCVLRNQLVEQLRHVRDEKRRLRRTIRDLEADMLRHQGPTRYPSSSVGDDEDGDGHLEPVYAQYRHARAKLRLLEALVAKHDGSATL